MENIQVDINRIKNEIERIHNIVTTIKDGFAAITVDTAESRRIQKETLNSLILFCDFYYSFVNTLLEQYPVVNAAVGYAQDLNDVYKTLDAYLEEKGIRVYRDGEMWYWSVKSRTAISPPFTKAILAYLDAATNN